MNEQRLDTVAPGYSGELVPKSAGPAATYAKTITDYYDIVTDLYRMGWDESHHFPMYTSGDQPLAEALSYTERFFADRGGFRPGMRVLDVGSGVGGPALNIARHSGAHVTGVDLTAKRIDIARVRTEDAELSHRVDFVLGNMMELPFPDNSFDGAYSFEALCYASDKRLAYSEIGRVLKPGSPFVGTDWLQAPSLSPAQRALVDPVCRCHAIAEMTSLDRLRDNLQAAGFANAEVGNLDELGDVDTNWRLLETLTAAVTPDMDLPDALKIMTEGGQALYRAADAGAFLIGYWQARKS
ncbi:MAG: Sterol 24-C-methyltransferase [Frankiales bacterium]|nr:Sterol 24-C-methyltransferase [Frankiales bacterium]